MSLSTRIDDEGRVEVTDPETGASVVFTAAQMMQFVISVPTNTVRTPTTMNAFDRMEFLESACDAALAYARRIGMHTG